MSEMKKSRRKVKNRKISVLLASLALIMMIGVYGTAAYLVSQTEAVTNTFIPGNVDSHVDEDIENGVKNNVTIVNDGNVDAYVRAMVVVTWQDSGGNVYSEMPVEGRDYSVTIPASNSWKQKDNYYYYTKKVIPNGTTDALLTEGQLLTDTAVIPSGYSLSIEILSQTIQADPKDAVESVWPVTVGNDGSLTVKSGTN